MIEIHKPIPLLKKLLPLRRPEQDILYVPSQFALAFDHNDRQYVYNTLTKQLIEAQLPGQCRAGEEYDELITSYFLVPEDKDESVLYRSISELMRIYTKKDGEKGYIILPTLRCNARCVYCYEENYKPVTMSPETVEQTIRYIIDSRAGGVVICPDGTLSPCEHLQGSARFGDVWNGVTDEGARREFCRTDRIREKCRKCPFLPDCTGFASCPITDSHCRELHNMQTLDALKYFIDNKVINSDDDVPVC